MKVASFFSGCGGLDLGFEQAGIDVIWANDIETSVHETYQYNHPNTVLCKSDIRSLHASDIPDCDGFIGGPPCQSWSEGGKQLGLNDERGKLFLDYVRLIKEKQPKFFVIENVKGIISDKHLHTFLSFLSILEQAGYIVNYAMLNAADFRIPQDRYRVFVVGFQKSLDCNFHFPQPLQEPIITLRKAIGDIDKPPRFYTDSDTVSPQYERWLNHDVFAGPFDAKFMSRNRIRTWDELSFTIQAQAKNCPLHPQAPTMKYIAPNKRIFVPGYEHLYRRLSIRECARIQTFPDSFRFFYNNIKDGYKMVGNAVPPRIAKFIAINIKEVFASTTYKQEKAYVLVGYYKNETQLCMTLQNRLYYVRTGFRRGALQMPIGIPSPKYLLLHNKKDRSLYKLIPEPPAFMKAADLSAKGFSPSGNEYLAFRLESTEEVRIKGLNLQAIQFQGKYRNATAPYITDVEALIKDTK